MDRARARDIAFVFQLFALYPHMNVRKNIAFPLVAQGEPRAEIRTRVAEAARLLRIDHLLDRPVSGLAGGDRQRVALGRAIVRRPKCFLMDEPLGTLDAELREIMVRELRELHNRIHATTVYVTHDQMEAMAMADKIAVMNHGVIEQYGTPAGNLRPPRLHVRRRLHRRPADELHPLPRPAPPAAPRPSACATATVRVPRLARGRRPRPTSPSASAPSTSASPPPASSPARSTASNTSAPPRSSPSRPPTASSRPASRPTSGCSPARPSASPSTAPASRSSTPPPAAPSPATSGRPMAEVALPDLSKSFGRTRAVRDLSLTHRATASSSSCSAPPAPARPRRCASSPASSAPTPAPSPSAAPASKRSPPPSATSPSSSSNTRSTPTSPSARTSPSRSRPPAAASARAAIEARVAEIARLVRIDHKLDNRATRLSGGEMQRVAIGRALVREPEHLPDGRARSPRSTPSSAPRCASSSSTSSATSAPPSSTSPTTRPRR